MNESENPTHFFAIGIESHPTQVEMLDFPSGRIGIVLTTARDGREPLQTLLNLHPLTFRLLSEAMHMAAHRPDIWRPIPGDAPEVVEA